MKFQLIYRVKQSIENTKMYLLEGVDSSNALSKQWYNLGIQNFIISMLIVVSAYLAISKFSVDTTGLKSLFTISSGVIFFVLWTYFVASSHNENIESSMDEFKAKAVAVVVPFIGLIVPLFENSKHLDNIQHGLVGVTYVIEHKYLVTIETLALIAFIFFTIQAIKVNAEKRSESILKNPTILITFVLLLVKPIYTLLGFSYESMFVFLSISILYLLLQKSLILYINNPGLMESEKAFNFYDYSLILSLTISILLLNLSPAYLFVVIIFGIFTHTFNAYKSIEFNVAALVFLLFAIFLVLILFLVFSIEALVGYAKVAGELYLYWLIISVVVLILPSLLKKNSPWLYGVFTKKKYEENPVAYGVYLASPVWIVAAFFYYTNAIIFKLFGV
mgnify:CR=1 FL=1